MKRLKIEKRKTEAEVKIKGPLLVSPGQILLTRNCLGQIPLDTLPPKRILRLA